MTDVEWVYYNHYLEPLLIRAAMMRPPARMTAAQMMVQRASWSKRTYEVSALAMSEHRITRIGKVVEKR